MALIPALPFLMFTATAGPVPVSEADALAAAARLYSVVRWFHPSDAAAAVSWDRMAVLCAQRVRAAHDADALSEALLSVFGPVTVGLQLGPSLPPAPPLGEEDAGLVAWRHLGLGRVGHGEIYQSARTSRGVERPLSDFVGLGWSLPAEGLRGETLRLEGRLRARPSEDGSGAALWLRVDQPGDRVAFFKNTTDRLVRDDGWTEREITAEVALDASRIVLGPLVTGYASGGFTDLRLSVREADGSWRELPLPALTDSKGWWSIGGPDRKPMRGASGDHGVWISSPTAEVKVPFDLPPRIGEIADLDLGAGLRARVPLTLSDEAARVQGAQRQALEALQQELWSLPAPRAEDPDVAAADTLVAWGLLRHFYPYWSEVGVDWEDALPSLFVATPQSADEHLDDLALLVARARDGHGRITDPRAAPRAALPVRAALVEGQLVVVASDVPESVRVGDVLSSVDGRPSADWLAERRARCSGSSQWCDAVVAGRLSVGPRGGAVALGLVSPEGERIVTLTRDREQAPEAARPAQVAELRPSVWYVDLTRASWEQVEPRLKELAAARVLVVDLRGYPTDAGMRLLPHLLSAPERDRWMHVPQLTAPGALPVAWEHYGWDLEPKAPHVGARVAFLTDGRAISYAESVMGYAGDLHLGTIFGAPTAGTNGNINSLSLPSGVILTFTGMRVTTHDGGTFHLRGVPPDRAVAPTVEGVRAGRDEVLEAALDWAG